MSSSCPAEPSRASAWGRRGSGRQQGVALITVLLVVAIATIAVVEIATRQQFDLRRAQVRNGLEQARLIAVGAESVAAWVLSQDRRDNSVDSLSEAWTQPVATSIAGAEIQGQLTDLQGRLNLNNLYQGGTENSLAIGRLQRLLQRLELPAGLESAIIDWVDPDAEVTGADGAEDGYYASLQRPYRAANRPFVSVSELRLVRGVTEEIYAKLQPLVSALPANTSINVNTAPADVVKSLSADFDAAAVDEWLQGRTGEDARVFEKVADFVALLGVDAQKFDSTGLGVTSDYFQLQAQVLLGQVQYVLFSQLRRNNNGATEVQMRYRGMI